jgi:single-strand DNA-binding protein
MTTADDVEVRPSGRNEVTLVGRVAAAAIERQLPSGTTIVSARLIVDRDPAEMSWSRQRVDTIDCVAWSGRAQRSVRGWRQGERVQVTGSIRRRFFRTTGGAGSRVEVEIKQTSRVR